MAGAAAATPPSTSRRAIVPTRTIRYPRCLLSRGKAARLSRSAEEMLAMKTVASFDCKAALMRSLPSSCIVGKAPEWQEGRTKVGTACQLGPCDFGHWRENIYQWSAFLLI